MREFLSAAAGVLLLAAYVLRPHNPRPGVGMSGLHPVRAVKAWRKRRADQVEEWLHRRTPHIRNATPDKEH